MPHRSQECRLSSPPDGGGSHGSSGVTATSQLRQVCACWFPLQVFGQRWLLTFTSLVTLPNTVHKQCIYRHKHLPRHLHRCCGFAAEVKWPGQRFNQRQVTRSMSDTFQQPYTLSKLPCFMHCADLLRGNTDQVKPGLLRDHCFQFYEQVPAGGGEGSQSTKQRGRSFPVGFLHGCYC